MRPFHHRNALMLSHLVQSNARVDEADKPSERVQSFEHGLESLTQSRGSNRKFESPAPDYRDFPNVAAPIERSPE